MEGMCTDCKKRSYCKELCPEAEIYADQDHVKLREKTIGIPMYADNEWPEPGEKHMFTPMEKKILQLLSIGKSRKHISQVLDITRNTLEKHISNIKKKAEEKWLKV
jgi:DNA-binding NarL/FixJ family response regulator